MDVFGVWGIADHCLDALMRPRLNQAGRTQLVRKEGEYYGAGIHDTEKEAALSYNRIAKQVYGDKAQLNVIEEQERKRVYGDIREMLSVIKKKPCNLIRDCMVRV
jgi:hypothetical protein